MKLKSILTLIAVLALACISTHAQPPFYNATFIISFPQEGALVQPMDMNNFEEVVGYLYPYSGPQSGQEIAFLYSEGKITQLGTLGGNITVAQSVNDFGQIAGMGTNPQMYMQTFSYEKGSIVDLGGSAGSTVNSLAMAINNNGTAVGAVGSQAVAFLKGSIINLGLLYPNGASVAYGINNNYTNSDFVDIVGMATGDTLQPEAVLYSEGGVKSLHYICPAEYSTSSRANGINDVRQIIGYCQSSTQDILGFFIYDFENMSYNIVGSISFTDLNNLGESVGIAPKNGSTPILQANSTVYNLYDLIQGDNELYSLFPVAINDNSQILAMTSQGVVLLTPILD